MEDFVRIFKSPDGDVYHITLSEDNGILSAGVHESLGEVHIVGIDLRRLSGKHVTGNKVLSALSETIADYFLRDENVIICYYCDFLNSTRDPFCPTEIYHERHGGQTEQTKQMDTDGQSCDIGNQDNPSSTAGLIHLVLPFQNQPEHQGGQETGEGIDFCLDCREPERVAEGVDQCANHAACLNSDDIGKGWSGGSKFFTFHY